MRNKKNTSGFSVLELLIALAIMGLLLTAIAAVFNASVTNYRTNEDIIRTVNNARQALTRMTTQLRTAEAVDPNSPANECTLITADGQDITYRYDNSDNKIYQIDNTTADSHTLCDNVTSAAFTKNAASDGGSTYVKSVQISLTVESGGIEQKTAAAAAVRRNLQH